VVFFERLGKSRRRLIANAGRNPGDGIVARFEHEGGLVHPTRDEVTVHRLADETGKASREGRAAEPNVALVQLVFNNRSCTRLNASKRCSIASRPCSTVSAFLNVCDAMAITVASTFFIR
jgi:hypothetical protein